MGNVGVFRFSSHLETRKPGEIHISFSLPFISRLKSFSSRWMDWCVVHVSVMLNFLKLCWSHDFMAYWSLLPWSSSSMVFSYSLMLVLSQWCHTESGCVASISLMGSVGVMVVVEHSRLSEVTETGRAVTSVLQMLADDAQITYIITEKCPGRWNHRWYWATANNVRSLLCEETLRELWQSLIPLRERAGNAKSREGIGAAGVYSIQFSSPWQRCRKSQRNSSAFLTLLLEWRNADAERSRLCLQDQTSCIMQLSSFRLDWSQHH